MTEATVTDSTTDTLRSAAERMGRQQTGSLLVMDGGRLAGSLTERDLLRAVALGADPAATTVDEAMTTEVFTVLPDMPLVDAAREMATRWLRHLPVTEDGRLVGIGSMQRRHRDLRGARAGQRRRGARVRRAGAGAPAGPHRARRPELARPDLDRQGRPSPRREANAQGRSNGRGMPSRACGQGQSRCSGSVARMAKTRSRSRPTFRPNSAKTSSWVTPSPSVTPASVSVTSASVV